MKVSEPSAKVELQEAIAKDLNDSAAIRKKRTRKSSRGGGHGGANLPSPTFSIKSAASYDDPIACDQQSKNTLNSTFKPMLATPSNIQTYQQQQQSTSKDKGMSYAISNSNSSSISSHSQNSSKAKGVMGTGIALIGNSNTAGTGAGGGYHLPTLHGAMSNSSSTSSTLPGVNASGGTGDTSPYGGAYIKKHGGGVPSIAENQPSYSIGAEHLDFINHHANVRQSMTSHGGRINPPMASHGALVHPFSFSGAPLMANGAPPKPPPPTTSSYMRNPYLAAQTPTTKHRVAPHGGPATVTKHGHATRLGGYANSSSLQASSDIYSPKKVNTGQVAASTTHSGTKKAHGETLTPQGIYVPPKTSHSTIRGTLNQNGDKVAKARRENDVRSF
uniref:Uncharacterized protein n=1 Tax=Globisporangium ultimum (strain ATCC 200006 / CBS 805.95 / DAOM BR144) TaxID=431595 RepID=K3WWT9_GLOUD